MKSIIKNHLLDSVFLFILCLGFVAIAAAQEESSVEQHKKKVRVEVEITENGKTSTSIQELDLDKESINGQLDEMVEEIEMILEEAVQDVEETDLEITIRRNSFGNNQMQNNPNYRGYVSVIPEHSPRIKHNHETFLGVYAEGVDDNELTETGLEEAVKIERIVSGSAAEKSGLEVDDIIYKMDSESVGSFDELSRIIQSHQPGETMTLDLIRDGEEKQMTAELGRRDGNGFQWADDKRGFLGIEGGDDNGASITRVIENSAAEKAGLQEGDIITSIDNEEVTSFSDLAQIVKQKDAGDQIDMTIIRDGDQMNLSAELGQKSNSNYSNYNSGNNSYQYSYHYDYNEKSDCDLSKKAFLGVMAKNIDEKGIEISKVFPNTTAEKMGLQSGDVIRKIDGAKINSVNELVEELNSKSAGEELKVDYERDGKKQNATETLGNKADHQDAIRSSSSGNSETIIMRLKVEDLDEDEIAELSQKSGESLDASNSLQMYELQFSPNPTAGEFQVRFELPEEGDTAVRIFDQNGRTISTQTISGFSGIYSNEFDITEEQNGVYFISISQNGKGKTARVVKQ